MGRVKWVDPAKIQFKISPSADLKGRTGGDWDLERRSRFDQSVKFRSMMQRYREGRRWEDTDLFRDVYARRFEEDSEIRGTTSIEALAAQYYDRIDGMHDSMKREGFSILAEDGRGNPLPGLFIGRNREIFIGNQGNHRLAIAQVLGLNKFAGEVICRHRLAA